MNKSLSRSDAIDLINNWVSASLPIKVVLLSKRPTITLLLRGEAWPVAIGDRRAEDCFRVGVEGLGECIVSLADAVFELEDSVDAPQDLREEAAARTVPSLTCT